MILVLQFGVDRHDDLVNVNPGYHAWGIPEGTLCTSLKSTLQIV